MFAVIAEVPPFLADKLQGAEHRAVVKIPAATRPDKSRFYAFSEKVAVVYLNVKEYFPAHGWFDA